jgi:MSHA pilin protein MshD
MNTGQMLITIAAIFLLSTVILTVNRGFLNTETVMMDNRYGIIAVSLATSTMEAAINKAFDERSDTVALTSLNQLTPKNNLGLDAGDSIDHPEKFDDFDDFDCYRDTTKIDEISLEGANPPQNIIFYTNCQIDYVTDNNPAVISTQPTWHKRIIVKVYSPGLQDTVRMSSVYSYFFFR